jgi:hypothetical protein
MNEPTTITGPEVYARHHRLVANACRVQDNEPIIQGEITTEGTQQDLAKERQFTEARKQVAADFQITSAIGGAIKDLGTVSAGSLYAHLMGKMSLDALNACIETLCKTGLVRREPSHLLIWIGGGK